MSEAVHRRSEETDSLDLAIVGAGAAGTYVASAMIRARPDWSVALFERTDRVGGRLRSRRVPGIDHPIELGGMRFMTSHPHVQAVVDALGLTTHAFPEGRGPDRYLLRDHLSAGPDDPTASVGYDVAERDRGRSAGELLVEGFRTHRARCDDT